MWIKGKEGGDGMPGNPGELPTVRMGQIREGNKHFLYEDYMR